MASRIRSPSAGCGSTVTMTVTVSDTTRVIGFDDGEVEVVRRTPSSGS